MKINFKRIDHIQISIPEGDVERARKFYVEILGLKEIERPASLKTEEGLWLIAGNTQIHISTENTINKSKRHPAFEIDDLDNVKNYLIEKGVKIMEQVKIEGIKRFSIYDYWDNRIELLEKEK